MSFKYELGETLRHRGLADVARPAPLLYVVGRTLHENQQGVDIDYTCRILNTDSPAGFSAHLYTFDEGELARLSEVEPSP